MQQRCCGQCGVYSTCCAHALNVLAHLQPRVAECCITLTKPNLTFADGSPVPSFTCHATPPWDPILHEPGTWTQPALGCLAFRAVMLQRLPETLTC